MGDLDGIAELDLGRASRRGYPEAVYAEGKSVEQLRAIASSSPARTAGSSCSSASCIASDGTLRSSWTTPSNRSVSSTIASTPRVRTASR